MLGEECDHEGETDGGADDLGPDVERDRSWGDPGEGVGEDPADGDGTVRERRGRGEPVGGADVGADRGRGQGVSSGPGEQEDQRDQARGRDDLPDSVPGAGPVRAGDLHEWEVEHGVGQDGPGDRADGLGGDVGGDVDTGDAGGCPAAEQPVGGVTTGLKCAPETGPNIRISTANPNTVAVLFSSSCNPVLPGDSCWAAIPDPTTTLTSRPVPMTSASNRRGSVTEAGLTSDISQPYLTQQWWRQIDGVC